jgi:hypothetical protein
MPNFESSHPIPFTSSNPTRTIQSHNACTIPRGGATNTHTISAVEDDSQYAAIGARCNESWVYQNGGLYKECESGRDGDEDSFEDAQEQWDGGGIFFDVPECRDTPMSDAFGRYGSSGSADTSNNNLGDQIWYSKHGSDDGVLSKNGWRPLTLSGTAGTGPALLDIDRRGRATTPTGRRLDPDAQSANSLHRSHFNTSIPDPPAQGSTGTQSWYSSYLTSTDTVLKSVAAISAVGAACYHGYSALSNPIAGDVSATGLASAARTSATDGCGDWLSTVGSYASSAWAAGSSKVCTGLSWAGGRVVQGASGLWSSVGGMSGVCSSAKWDVGQAVDGVSGLVQALHDMSGSPYSPRHRFRY